MTVNVQIWLTDNLVIFQDSTRRFVASELAPHEARWWQQQRIDRDAWAQG
ncbi:hypothetical protein GCM10009104_13150 [Marinobacterium maritimum]|uniref:Acyl-CoA dehydrogenase/oxidase N-terminal domain-containing protein n=1 Tax=Marinobacterium maritimum TaxID=500162 RepID=A0ABN1I4H3_9GAMM